MIYIPVKISEPVNLQVLIEKYLEKTNSLDELNHIRPFLQAMNGFREAFTSSNEMSNLDYLVRSLEHYYSAICGLESRVQLERTSNRLNWIDSYSKKVQSFGSFLYEKVAALYALAGIWSKIAFNSDLKSPNGHKFALNAYQVSNGYLKECIEILQSPTDFSDLNTENFYIWSEIITGLGYLTMFDKLDKTTANKSNVAKLAFTIHKHLDIAMSRLGLVPSFPKEIEKYLRVLTELFAAVTEGFCGLMAKEQVGGTGKGFGIAVARLRYACDLLPKPQFTKNLNPRTTELVTSLSSLLQSEKAKAEEENYAIYMESVPTSVPKSLLDEVTLFTGKKPELKHFPEQELINILLPIQVQSLHSEYESTMLEILNNTNDKISQKLQKFEEFFKSNTFIGLPPYLWSQISMQQANAIDKQIQTMNSLHQSCINELTKNREKVMKEEAEDEEMKKIYSNDWNRVPSCIANADIKIEIEKMFKEIDESHNQDCRLTEEFTENEHDLRTLNEAKDHFDRLIPTLDLKKEADKDLIINDIKKSNDGIRKTLDDMKKSIFNKAKYQALRRIYQDNIPKDVVFNELKIELFEFQLRIEKEVDVVSPKIERFFKEFAGLCVEIRAKKIIDSLTALVEKKKILSLKFDQRLVRYSEMFDKTLKLSVTVDEFLAKRVFDKQEVLGRLSSGRNALQTTQSRQSGSGTLSPYPSIIPKSPNN